MRRLLLTAIVVLFSLPGLAQAQLQEAEEAERWSRISTQLIRNINSPDPIVCKQGLKNAIIMASRYRTQVALHDAVRPIIRVYRRDNDREHRDLALAALQAIGTAESLSFLARHATREQVDASRALVLAVLQEHESGSSSS